MQKKMVACFLAVVLLVSFVFAQDSELEKTLDDYFDEITALLKEEEALDEQFKADHAAAMYELLYEVEDKAVEICNEAQHPWENAYEYSDRLDSEVTSLLEEFKIALGKKDSELRTPYIISKAEIADKKVALWAEISGKEFVYKAGDIVVAFDDFDVYNKYWPLTVSSANNRYVLEQRYYYPNMNAIAEAYTVIQDAIDNDNMAADVIVRVQQNTATSNTYEIRLVKVNLYTPDEPLCTYVGNDEIITIVKIEI